MSICDSLLIAKYQQLLATAARTNINNNNNIATDAALAHKIWNPAFTESEHERRTKQLLLNSFAQHSTNTAAAGLTASLIAAQQAAAVAAVGGLLPPAPKLVIPTAATAQPPPSSYQVSWRVHCAHRRRQIWISEKYVQPAFNNNSALDRRIIIEILQCVGQNMTQ